MAGQQYFHHMDTKFGPNISNFEPVAKPPMTSKAAKEAYRKANKPKGGKISRAEQRRLDALEIAAQRKAHEKERNAAKAKAVRDAKAEKARLEMEKRKANGLPEPSRFVRASQPTIKGFVRLGAVLKHLVKTGTTTGKRRREEMSLSEEDEDGDSVSASQDGERPRKMIALERPANEDDMEFGSFPDMRPCFEPVVQGRVLDQIDEEDEEDFFSSISQGRGTRMRNALIPQREDGGEEAAAPKENIPSQSGISISVEDEDDFGDPPSLSQMDFSILDQPLEKQTELSTAVKRSKSASQRGSQPLNLPVRSSSLPRRGSQHRSRRTSPLSQLSVQSIPEEEAEDMIQDQLLSESFDAGNRSGPVVYCDSTGAPKVPWSSSFPGTESARSNPHEKTPIITQGPLIKTLLRRTTSSIFAPKRSTALNSHPTVLNAPLRTPLSPKSNNIGMIRSPRALEGHKRKALAFEIHPDLPLIKPSIRTPSLPPPSTQAFLEANIDEFFPSSSQEVLELLDEFDEMPSNTQIAREISAEASDEEMEPALKIILAHEAKVIVKSDRFAAVPNAISDEDIHGLGLALEVLSSQDLEISSQDLIDMDTPAKPIKTVTASAVSAKPKLSTTAASDPPSPPTVKNSPALTVFASSQKPHLQAPSMGPSSQPNASQTPTSTQTPSSKPRFFEEKEDDLLQGALYESRIMAKKAAVEAEAHAVAEAAAIASFSRPKLVDVPPRRASLGERKNVQSAGNNASVVAVGGKKEGNNGIQKSAGEAPKKMASRTISNASRASKTETDYGNLDIDMLDVDRAIVNDENSSAGAVRQFSQATLANGMEEEGWEGEFGDPMMDLSSEEWDLLFEGGVVV